MCETAFMTTTVAHLSRLRLNLAYDGTGFHGWAAQPGLRTVEGLLTESLETILRSPVQLTVAGRTDAGVHARGQVAHFDVPDEALQNAQGRSLDALTGLERRVNALLARASTDPKGSSDVVVHSIRRAEPGFDARFSALSRTYTYQVCDDPRAYDPLQRAMTLWVPHTLDVVAMNRAAAALLGEHDFLAFCKPREGATTIRTLLACESRRQGPVVTFTVQADAFCHSMVRTLVGTLLRVGDGSRTEEWPAQRLQGRIRDGEVVVAPPHPLTLERVEYPSPEQFAARANMTRARRSAGDETDCCGE